MEQVCLVSLNEIAGHAMLSLYVFRCFFDVLYVLDLLLYCIIVHLMCAFVASQ